MHTCCFVVACVISYSTVVRYVTWIILFLKLCDARYTHKPLFECVSERVNTPKYIKHRGQEFVTIMPHAPDNFSFSDNTRGEKIEKRFMRIRRNLRCPTETEPLDIENCRHDSTVFSRDVERIATSTNSRRRRKLIKPNGILEEVDARLFPSDDQLINFLGDHSRLVNSKSLKYWKTMHFTD